MANPNDDRGKFWPYLILGFVAIGVLLGYWTVRSAISLPVHEANDYMMKYQLADINFNSIQEKQEAFDAAYRMKITGLGLSDFKAKNLKRKAANVYALNPDTTFEIVITDLQGRGADDLNVSVMLTRPFTQKEDQVFTNLQGKGGHYTLAHLKPGKPGRYILAIRAQKGKAVGYAQFEAYLKP